MNPTPGEGEGTPAGETKVFADLPAAAREPDLIRDQAEGSGDDEVVTFGRRIRTRARQNGNGPGPRPEEP